MTGRHIIVVSAENNPYMAWQSKLLHYSCVSRLQQAPLFIVHETGGELHPGFQEIRKADGHVRSCPNYKLTKQGDLYSPKNLAGTLLHAAEMCEGQGEFIVLCDPDMLFVRRPAFPETLSGDFYSYINFDHAFVETARARMSVPLDAVNARKEDLRCGGPYVVPVANARALAEAWLEAVDAFPPRTWEDVMYAFGLAAVKLDMKITLTHMMESNYWPDATLKADVIHYCYGDETWNKRHYFTEEQIARVWEPTVSAPRESVLGEILRQVRQAASFYGNMS